MKKRISILLSIVIISLMFFNGCSKDVSNYDLNINFNNKTYSGKFFGTIKHGVPINNKQGKFVSGKEGDSNYFEYDGEWNEGNIFGKGFLKQNNYSLVYDKKTFEGVFEGNTLNGKPNGKGEFKTISSDDVILEYSGDWKNGKMFGKGDLKYNEYVIKYHDGIVRTGTFVGNVLNGIPEGEGKFATENDKHEKYSYSGNFSNGKFNGFGKRNYENGKNGIQEGNWKDNDFYPSVVELIQELGTYKDDCEYRLTDSQKKFIDKNQSAFTSHKKAIYSKLINSNFSLKSFKKNPTSFKPALVQVSNLKVIQIMEYATYGNKTLTFILASDFDNDTYYSIYKYDRTPKVVEDSTVSIVFMPLDHSTYETTDGGENWAIVGFATDVSK